MKKSVQYLLVILCAFLSMFTISNAQIVPGTPPEGFIYQAESRDNNGKIIARATLEVTITILKNTPTGEAVLQETHTVSTDRYGLFTLTIGQGIPVLGYFDSIEWEMYSHFLNVQILYAKGNSQQIVDMGTTQLLSVPYALHSKTAISALSASFNDITDLPPNLDIDVTDDFDGDYNSLVNQPTNLSEFVNDEGFINNPDDADADPTNELIIETILNGSKLEITDAGGTDTVDLSSLSSYWNKNDSNIYYNAGNVGIGTTNPGSPLTIASNDTSKWWQDNLVVTSDVGIPQIRLDHTGDTTSLGFQFAQGWEKFFIERRQDMYTVNSLWGFDYGNKIISSWLPLEIQAGYGTAKPILRLEHNDSPVADFLQISTNGNLEGDILTINSDGKMGVGITNPLTKFQADGNITFAPAGKTANESRFLGQTIASQSSFNANMGFGGMEIENIDVIGDDDSEQQIHFWTHDQGVSSERRMTIDINGNVGIGTSTPLARLDVRGDDGVFFNGTFGSGSIPSGISGSTMIWYPKKAAFRVGYDDGGNWDDANIGDYSIAMGSWTSASGIAATAFGSKTNASGDYSLASGFETSANGISSVALGENTSASGDQSTAMGQHAQASGVQSTALGWNTSASGEQSVAMGFNTTASGGISTAMGGQTVASGAGSTAMGSETKAESYLAVAMGRFNVGGGADGGWNDPDPLFEIGIGQDDANRANALTVLKNGNVGIGTATPFEKLHVAGNLKLDGTFGDESGNVGSAGQILSSTGTGTQWITPTSGGDFSNGGEAGGEDRTLGNTDNYALGLKTNGISRLNIQNDGGIRMDGNIGIGIAPDLSASINKTIQMFASQTFSNSILNLSGHNSGTIYLESRRNGFTPETSGKRWTISSGSGSVLDLDKFYIYNPDDGVCFIIRDGGNVGLGVDKPNSKLQVNGAVQIANDGDAPAANKVGALRYRADSNNSYVEMCMQTGANLYAWVVVKQNSW